MTKILVGGMYATYRPEDDSWVSKNVGFAKDLTLKLKIARDRIEMLYDPFPEGSAVMVAKEMYPDLKVISMDDPPKFRKDVVY